ncbi:MAG: hypothetical protein KC621_05465, partial [Myxococcales bacterium]|nr:hypothetical protein [Myxococcales bacterium]
MSRQALVVVAGVDPDLDVWTEAHGARPGPRTATLVALALDPERAPALVADIRASAPDGRIAVHVTSADAIGFSQTARVLHLVPAGATLLTQTAAEVFAGAREVARVRLPGTLRRERLYAVGEVVPAVRPRLPEPPQVAFAREPDLASLLELVAFAIRVVDLSGPAGVGKSHLLVRLAHRLAEDGRCPVFLDVTGHTAFGALAALGRELGIPLDGRLGEERVLSRLASGIDRSPVDVIVLDHVPAVVVPALRELVQRTSVQWVFGGIRRVGVGSEVTYELRPLRASGEASAAGALLAARAPALGAEATALADELGGLPLAVEVVAGLSLDQHPLVAFEWLAERTRTLEELAERAFSALPDAARDRLLRLAVWPDALGVDMKDPEVRQLLDRGWLRVTYDVAVPGLPAIRLHPQLRRVLLEQNAPPESCYVELYSWMSAQSEALHRMLFQDRAPAVFDLVSAWVPTLDAILTQVLKSHPLSSRDLAFVAPILELRVACGTRLGSVDPVLEGLEKALQGAGARFDLDPVVVIRLFQARGQAFMHRREWERARADLERARTLAERRREPAYASRLSLLLAQAALGSQRLDLAWQELERVEVPEDALWAGEAGAFRGTLLLASGRPEEALAAFGEALATCSGGDPALCAAVLTERAVLLRRMGDVDGARLAYLEAVDAWGTAGRPENESAAMFQLALLLQGQGDLDGALGWLEEVDRRARFSGEDARRGLVCVQRALVQLERGDL